MWALRWAAVVGAALLLIAAAPAAGYDSGPHGDMTVDAMRAEGFGQTAAEVAWLQNYLIDFYGQYNNNAYSGHATGDVIAATQPSPFEIENWAPAVMRAAETSHFDATANPAGFADTAAVAAEWSRLRRATYKLVQGAKAARNPLDLLAAIGMSLHVVQDFYAHGNWVERTGDGGSAAPWNEAVQGSHPTWFDVPAKEIGLVYTASSPGHRYHGSWQADGNRNLLNGINKDWPGRPRYSEAFITSYFATRQWLRAIRTWLRDDALWAAAQRYVSDAAGRRALRNDIDEGVISVSSNAGRWYGSGGPCQPDPSIDPPEVTCGDGEGYGGTLVGSRAAIKDYHGDADPTVFRKTFERLVPGLALNPLDVSDAQVPVGSSRGIQQDIEFVRLRITAVTGIDLEDPIPTDGADLYARAAILGKDYQSAVIDDHDSFAFPKPYAPHTFMRAVTRARQRSTPVTTLTIRVRTGDVRFAGTNDDVYLRISPSERFALDKSLYDDFERGDNDTYSVPIDDLARRGLTREDIQYLQIEKSADGAGGGWRLGGIKVLMNGTTLYENNRIDRWLEDNRRTWRATGFARDHRKPTRALAVWMDLRDEDGFVYGDDDQGDINRYDNRDAVVRAYTPGTVATATVTGGNELGGRLGKGGDKARLTYMIDTLTPVLAPPRPTDQVTPPAASPPGRR